MRYFVYLLVAKSKNGLITYVGYTNNLKNRLKLHNSSKGAKFTKGKKWKILYRKVYNTKSEAMKNEYILKKNRKKRLELKKKFITNKLS